MRRVAAAILVLITMHASAVAAPPRAPRNFRLAGSPGASWPNATNTGPSNPAILVPCGDIVVTTDGAVIENVETGFINVKANNVTIRNFRINTNTYWGIYCNNGDYTNIVIEDGEINGGDECHDAINGSNYTARRVHIHNIGGDAFKAGSYCRIESCYIHEIGQAPGAHGDGVQMMGGTDNTIVNNNFDLTTGEITACVFPGGGDTVYNILVEGNRLNGGGWCVYGNDYMTCRNNIFGRACGYGPATNSMAEWTNNRWEDTNELIDY